MTAEPPSAPPHAPSWAPPIVAGALLAALLLVLSWGFQFLPGGQAVACCCCLAELLPVGAVPAWMALRRDPRLTAGQGFAVSFIGAGLGYVVAAAVGVALALSNGGPSMQQQAREAMQQAASQMPPDQAPTPEQIQQAADLMAKVLPFMPVILAAVMTVMAALVGLVTVLVLRRPPPGQAPSPPPS